MWIPMELIDTLINVQELIKNYSLDFGLLRAMNVVNISITCYCTVF